MTEKDSYPSLTTLPIEGVWKKGSLNNYTYWYKIPHEEDMEVSRSLLIIYTSKKCSFQSCVPSHMYSFKKTEWCYAVQMFLWEEYQAAVGMEEKTDIFFSQMKKTPEDFMPFN